MVAILRAPSHIASVDQNTLAVFGTLFGTLATAIATVALWRATRVLAVETKRMADAAAQPQIVATIAPNIWTTSHLDIIVQNTGNATAFDIELSFNPPLSNGEARGEHLPIPLQRISLLKPGQSLSSYLSGVRDYLEKNFEVTTSWKISPNAIERETLSFWLNMADYKGISYLGGRDPLVQIADQMKKLREDWKNVSTGFAKIRADVFTSADRDRDQELIQQRFDELEGQREGLPNNE